MIILYQPPQDKLDVLRSNVVSVYRFETVVYLAKGKGSTVQKQVLSNGEAKLKLNCLKAIKHAIKNEFSN